MECWWSPNTIQTEGKPRSISYPSDGMEAAKEASTKRTKFSRTDAPLRRSDEVYTLTTAKITPIIVTCRSYPRSSHDAIDLARYLKEHHHHARSGMDDVVHSGGSDSIHNPSIAPESFGNRRIRIIDGNLRHHPVIPTPHPSL